PGSGYCFTDVGRQGSKGRVTTALYRTTSQHVQYAGKLRTQAHYRGELSHLVSDAHWSQSVFEYPAPILAGGCICVDTSISQEGSEGYRSRHHSERVTVCVGDVANQHLLLRLNTNRAES